MAAFRIDQEFKARNRKLTTQEYTNLAIRIESEGGPRSDSIIVGLIGDDKILVDGHNTYDICQEKGYKLPEEKILPFGSRQEALEWIDANQRSRRNLSLEDMKKLRSERVDRVAEARQEGQSTRQIAESEGVSQKRILDDLKEATDKGLSVDPESGKIVGKDGKKRNSEVIVCDRCKRLGTPVNGCKNCEDLRAQNRKKGKAAPRKKKSNDKAELPKSVKNAMADTWHADCAHTLSKIRHQCKGVFSWSVWLDGAVLDHLKLAEDCLLAAIPRRPCPECKGQKIMDKKPCQKCRQSGYLAGQAV